MVVFIMIMSFVLAILAVVVNGCTQLFYARSLGYKLKPTGFAYFIGAIGNLLTGNVVPISAQAETLTVSGLIKDFRARLGALLIASIVGILLGVTGAISYIVDFAGETIIFGMMSGVGLILADVSLTLAKQEKRIGIISMISAILIWIFTHDVVYTISVSVIVSTFDFCLLQKRRVDLYTNDSNEEYESQNWRFWKRDYWSDFKILKPKFNFIAIVGGLGIICLNIGTNISFGKITSGIARVPSKLDALTVINSAADIPSIMFGGMPIEAIISGTAAAPWPILAGIVMMFISGCLIFAGLMTKIGKYVPAQSIAGFLLIIGFALTLVPNLQLVANSDSPLEGIVAASVTMLTKNAFLGVTTGILVKFTGNLMGVL